MFLPVRSWIVPIQSGDFTPNAGQVSLKVEGPVHPSNSAGQRRSYSSWPSLLVSVELLGRSAWADGKHSHNGSSPLDHGCEKNWGKDRPVNHIWPSRYDARFAAVW